MQAQLSTAVCNNACAKFAAHSGGEIGPDNWTRVKMNIFLMHKNWCHCYWPTPVQLLQVFYTRSNTTIL